MIDGIVDQHVRAVDDIGQFMLEAIQPRLVFADAEHPNAAGRGRHGHGIGDIGERLGMGPAPAVEESGLHAGRRGLWVMQNMTEI